MYITYGNYLSGTDIVAAVIDSTDIDLFVDGGYVHFPKNRSLLMVPDITKRSELAAAADTLSQTFKSAQTYYNPIKIGSKDTPYRFIYIDAFSTEKEIEWLRNRNAQLNVNFTAETISRESKEAVIQKYFAHHIIKLSDILEGNLIEVLTPIVSADIELDDRLYQTYLQLLTEDFPF
jgi:hypothetical protein